MILKLKLIEAPHLPTTSHVDKHFKEKKMANLISLFFGISKINCRAGWRMNLEDPWHLGNGLRKNIEHKFGHKKKPHLLREAPVLCGVVISCVCTQNKSEIKLKHPS